MLFQESKNAKNIVYTGTPVKIKKKEYSINEKTKIIKDLGLKNTKPIVLIFGGSQGAKKINEAVIQILKIKLIKIIKWYGQQDQNNMMI